MANKEHSPTLSLINQNSCFDLQFRKDTRRERLNSPTYYRWKIQFVITAPKSNSKILQQAKKIIGCGNVSSEKGQARFSVQKIDDIANVVVPFFKKNQLAEKKKKDFELWQKSVAIIYHNKGKALATWKKHDLLSLIEIQKSSAKHKKSHRQPKWIEMAMSLTKTS